jgi:dihydrofolate synthase/folylpolyglutamate synthase
MVLFPHWPKFLSLSKSKNDIYNTYEAGKTILSKLGNPERKIPPVIHIAGTNGKGSVLAHLKFLLEVSGYKLHIHISPHLIDFNERIILASKTISDKYLYEIMEKCRVAAIGYPTTLFSATTIASFIAFAEIKADLTILEVGMGGQFDSTNVIDNPLISVITPISYDHTEFLGNSLEEIAYAKSGIIKPCCSCVFAKQPEIARRVLEAQAIKNKALVYRQDFEWECDEYQEEYLKFTSSGESAIFPRSALIGRHQIDNAGVAIAVATLLKNKYGFEKITHESIADGMQKVYWPARLEQIKSGRLFELLPPGWEIFLDGAHNEAGSKILAEWAAKGDSKLLYAIIGVTRGKDRRAFLSNLKPHIKHMYGVCVRSEIHAETSSGITEIAESVGIPAQSSESVKHAVIDICSRYRSPARIIICGSLYLAGDVKKINEGEI